MFTRFIHVRAYIWTSFFYGWITSHCMHISHFLYPFIHQWMFGLILLFDYCDKAVVDICVQVFAWVSVFKQWTCFWWKNGVAGSYGNFIFSLLRNCQTVFQSSGIILHSYHQCVYECSSWLYIFSNTYYFPLKKNYGHPWRRQWHPTPVLLPAKSHGLRSLVGCSPWGRWELDTTERLHFQFSLSCTGEGHGTRFQCSCLENPRDGGAWWAARCLWGRTESDTTEAT